MMAGSLVACGDQDLAAKAPRSGKAVSFYSKDFLK